MLFPLIHSCVCSLCFVVGRLCLVVGGVAGEGCSPGGSLLTYYINGRNGPVWPGCRRFNATREDSSLLRLKVHRYTSGDEVATYIETAGAYARHGSRVGDLDPRGLFRVKTIVIDVKAKSAADPNYEITARDIEDWICSYGSISPGTFVIVNTGWSFRRGARYFGGKDDFELSAIENALNTDLSEMPYHIPGVLSFSWPGLSEDAAELLVRLRVIGVGIDAPSVEAGWRYSPLAYPLPDTRALRRYLTGHGMYLVHNLLILDTVLPPRGLLTTLGVFRMREATRAPVTVYTEFCADATPSLKCYAADFRNIVLGRIPFYNGRYTLRYL